MMFLAVLYYDHVLTKYNRDFGNPIIHAVAVLVRPYVLERLLGSLAASALPYVALVLVSVHGVFVFVALTQQR